MITNELHDILLRRKKLHPEDAFQIEKCWEAEIELLTRNINETIKFIGNECTDDDFFWVSEVFQDVAAKTQSKVFVNAIKERNERVEDMEEKHSIQTDIKFAEMEIG